MVSSGGDTNPRRDDPDGREASGSADTSDVLFEATTAEAEAEVDLDELLEGLIGGPIKTIVDPVGGAPSGGGGGDGDRDGDGGGGSKVGASDKHKPVTTSTTMRGGTAVADDDDAVGDDAHKLCSMNSEDFSTMNGVLQTKNKKKSGSSMQPIIPIVSNTFVHGDDATTVQPKVKVEVLKKRKFVIA